MNHSRKKFSKKSYAFEQNEKVQQMSWIIN